MFNKNINVMKKLLFTAAVALFAFTTNAQWEQGNVLIYGGSNLGLNFGSSKTDLDGEETDGPKFSSINFSPAAGLFIADGFLVGLKLNVATDKTTATVEIDNSDEDVVSKSSRFTVGPAVRYYIGDSGLFGKAHVLIGSQSSEDQFVDIDPDTFEPFVADGDKFEQSVMEWALGLGFAILLNDNVVIEPCISFGGMTVTTKDVEYFDENFEEQKGDLKEKTTAFKIGLGVTGILD